MFWFRKKEVAEAAEMPSQDIKVIAKQQLDENRGVFESLKEYDEGKKDISTTNVKSHLRDLQPTV